MTQLRTASTSMTAVKVKLIPTAVSILFVTPKKMQRPR
jgi:hypothetical protein